MASTESTPPPFARGYEGFDGRVGRTAADSTPSWSQPSSADPKSPNIVLVLIDDMGYSDIGPFGSEIETPTLDRLAAQGFRLTNYHTTPLCSPSRAALLTGINPHRAGYGFVANADPGYPGLRLELGDDILTLPEVLRESGYATYAVGKWHLVRDANLAPGRSRDSWPTQRGFDRYYGSLEGLNSFYHPNQLISDNSVVDIDEYPEDYYLTDDLTDKAVSYIKDLRAHDSEKPFFLYFAHVAMHGPLQAKAQDQAKYRGRYNEGWDRIRESRFASQLAAGLFPEGTRQAPRNSEPGHDVPEWNSLTPEEQSRFARYMEVYAGMVDSVDQSVGRIVETLEDLGELDNTIIVFTSDNGGTAEGGSDGTRSYFAQFAHVQDPEWVGDVPHDESLIGGPQLGVHYPRGWGQTSNTPFRFYKGQSFAGGVRVPFVLSWPNGLKANAGSADNPDNGIRDQFAYVTDLTPTLLDLAGIDVPTVRNGLPAKEFDGVSAAELLRSPDAASTHTEQYTEMTGNRGYYKDGWKLLALAPENIDEPDWQLFDVTADPTELDNLADQFPDKVRELAEAWDNSAWANTVFPLLGYGVGALRRPEEAALSRPVRILAGTPTLERYRSSRLISFRDFDISIELSGYRSGDAGVLVSHGDPQGGYLLYVEDGHLHLGYNAFGTYRSIDTGPLAVGSTRIDVKVTVAPRLRWNLDVSVDGAPAGQLLDQVQLVGMAPWTGISVGIDARGPVSWDLHSRRGSFRYSGALRAVTYTPGAVQVPGRQIESIEREAEYAAD